MGYDGPLAVRNALLEMNVTADPNNDDSRFNAFTWRTYAERLQAAGVSWKVYQEYDNYGDNALAYFAAFRGAHADPTLIQRGRAWAEGSTKENATSRGANIWWRRWRKTCVKARCRKSPGSWRHTSCASIRPPGRATANR